MMDDVSLARAAQKGELEAFNALVLTHQEMAFNLAYRILSDENSAADATQTAFISAYKNLKSFRGGSFRAWLLRIVTNACYDELRRIKRQPTTRLEPVSNTSDDEIESPTWIADGSPSPPQVIEQSELENAIQHCLENLPGDFRIVAVMVDIEGLDYKEAAEIICKPLGTVKSRLARARMRLRDCLQQFWELLPQQFRLESEGNP